MVLFIAALWNLISVDLLLTRGNFRAVHHKVSICPVRGRPRHRAVQNVCTAVARACVWYPRQSLCLQRSAVTTCLLRRYGIQAQMLIGVQKLPFKAHAWVEVEGNVVNDKPYVREMYSILDRC